jgi:hypothetical protein
LPLIQFPVALLGKKGLGKWIDVSGTKAFHVAVGRPFRLGRGAGANRKRHHTIGFTVSIIVHFTQSSAIMVDVMSKPELRSTCILT